MSFLKRGINGQQSDSADDFEEQYEKLFPKIGRDFVSREDLESIVTRIMEILDPFGLTPLNLDDSAARERAREYKNNIENGKVKAKKYKDLVLIDEEEEE